MTKKDYIIIAGVLSRVLKAEQISNSNEGLKEIITNEFCYELKRQNPRFDSVKFKQAVNA